MKRKGVKMFVVTCSDKTIQDQNTFWDSLRSSRHRSISVFMDGFDHEWRYWQQRGYRCVPVLVTEIKPKRKK